MSKNLTLRVICVSIFLWGALHGAPLKAHPILTFEVASHVVAAPGQTLEPSQETYPLVVTLGHQYLALEAKGTRTIYDFARNRLLQIDLQKKTVANYSLYFLVAYRALEFQNRINLGGMLRGADVNAAHFNVAQIEHLFTLANEPNDTVIDAVKSRGTTEFRSQQQLLMTVSDKIQRLPEAYQAEYWRFLRYSVGGHPKIYASLSAISGVPTAITVVLSDRGIETRSLTLQSIDLKADTDYSLLGYEPAYPNQEPYDALKRVAPDAPGQLMLRAAKAVKDRDAAFNDGKYLDALLAYDDASLSTGKPDLDWLKSARARLATDEMSQRLIAAASMGAPSVHDTAAQQKALGEFVTIRALKPAYTDVVDVFEGNLRIALRDDQGKQLLIDALHDNPYLTGAWHDLGDYYYRSFHLEQAWSCWDAARRIAPDDALMQPVNQYEQQLRSKNPQLF